jgi:hypothetical protein
MIDEVYKDFFTDHQTNRVMESSEVWRNYSRSELARDDIRQKRAMDENLDKENKLMAQVEEFRQKIANNPELKAYFKKVKATLDAHPELISKVDPNFIKGIELLDLED